MTRFLPAAIRVGLDGAAHRVEQGRPRLVQQLPGGARAAADRPGLDVYVGQQRIGVRMEGESDLPTRRFVRGAGRLFVHPRRAVDQGAVARLRRLGLPAAAEVSQQRGGRFGGGAGDAVVAEALAGLEQVAEQAVLAQLPAAGGVGDDFREDLRGGLIDVGAGRRTAGVSRLMRRAPAALQGGNQLHARVETSADGAVERQGQDGAVGRLQRLRSGCE